MAVTGIALAVQEAWRELDNGGVGIALFAADVLVTAVITFALVGVLAGTVRGFGEGWRTAESRVRPEIEPPTEPAEEPAEEPASGSSTDHDRPELGVALEKKARALGRAIGATQRKARRS